MNTNKYAGQSWRRGCFDDAGWRWGLEIIGRDIVADANEKGVAMDGPMELWETDDSMGFFIGDTEELASKGWTRVAVLA